MWHKFIFGKYAESLCPSGFRAFLSELLQGIIAVEGDLPELKLRQPSI
jgi:hypothetical protein